MKTMKKGSPGHKGAKGGFKVKGNKMQAPKKVK